MTPEIQALPFDALRTLHREVGALIAEKRAQELEELRERAALLGFTAEDLAPKKTGRDKSSTSYRNPDNPSETYRGKGRKPLWLQVKLEEGHTLDEFRV